ncbi:MAG: DUF421 domain-containing protein [Candidimonas sp.]|nr:DUF421 domain-containing protein [Candidimonas sp.]
MVSFDWQRLWLDELPLSFLAEVAFRALFAYVVVFLFLKVSGRRGIRQLSVFELVVILTLGSAAGDVIFYEDVPILPVLMTFVVLLLLYRATTFLMGRSPRFASWMEGDPVTLIVDGQYELDSLARLNISEDEFFMELRQQGIEHLGQLRLGILEVDGDVSLYFYDNDAIRPGLSVLPPEHRKVYTEVPDSGLYACACCGATQTIDSQQGLSCPRCEHTSWSPALRTLRPR